jgi:hypothetical protein
LLSAFAYRRRAAVLLTVVLFAAAGCGISDYEDRMEQEVKLAQQIDDDNKNLVNAAETDTEELFFRPPHGINEKYIKDKDGNAALLEHLFYQYDNVDKPKDHSEFLNLYVAYTTEEKDDFQGQVWNALGRLDGTDTKPVTVEKVGARSNHRPTTGDSPPKPLTVEKASYRGKDMIGYVYFYKEGSYQVAFVFRFEYKDGETPQERPDKVTKLIDYSLSTLAVGDKAKKKKTAFRPRPAT